MQKSLSSQSGNLFIFSSQWCGPHKASGSSLNLHWALFEAKSARPSQTNPDPGRLNILKLKLKQTLIELIKLGWESANLFRILLTWIHNITFCQHLKKINYRIPFSSDTEDEEDKPKGGRKNAKKKQDDSSDDMVDWRYEYLQYRYITALKGKF